MKTGYYVVDTNDDLVFVGTDYNTALAWRDSLHPNSGVYNNMDDNINEADEVFYDYGYYVANSNSILVYVGNDYNTAVNWRDSKFPYSKVYKYNIDNDDIDIDDDSTDGLIWD